MKTFNTLQTQLEQAGLVQPQTTQIVVANPKSYEEELHELKEQQAVLDMLTPYQDKCSKCGTKMNRSKDYHSPRGLTTTYNYCFNKSCDYKKTTYALPPYKLVKMIKENNLPKDLSEEQKNQLNQMINKEQSVENKVIVPQQPK